MISKLKKKNLLPLLLVVVILLVITLSVDAESQSKNFVVVFRPDVSEDQITAFINANAFTTQEQLKAMIDSKSLKNEGDLIDLINSESLVVLIARPTTETESEILREAYKNTYTVLVPTDEIEKWFKFFKEQELIKSVYFEQLAHALDDDASIKTYPSTNYEESTSAVGFIQKIIFQPWSYVLIALLGVVLGIGLTLFFRKKKKK